MRDEQQNGGRTGSQTFALVIGCAVLLIALLIWSPWNIKHVASNPGPSGTVGSTTKDQTPPPAEGPSGNTVGSTAR